MTVRFTGQSRILGLQCRFFFMSSISDIPVGIHAQYISLLSVSTVTTNLYTFDTLGYLFQLYRANIRPVQNCESQTLYISKTNLLILYNYIYKNRGEGRLLAIIEFSSQVFVATDIFCTYNCKK